MLADPLTKSVVTKTFMRWVTTGTWLETLAARSTSKIRIRRAVRRPATYTEHDLVHNDFTPDDGTFGDQLQLNEAFYQALDFVDDLKLGTFLMQTDITISKPSGSSSSSAAPPAVQHDEPHDEFLVCPPCDPPRRQQLGYCTFSVYSEPSGLWVCGAPCVRIHDPDYVHRGECRCEAHARNRHYGK